MKYQILILTTKAHGRKLTNFAFSNFKDALSVYSKLTLFNRETATLIRFNKGKEEVYHQSFVYNPNTNHKTIIHEWRERQ